jgi:hypothetical protein
MLRHGRYFFLKGPGGKESLLHSLKTCGMLSHNTVVF